MEDDEELKAQCYGGEYMSEVFDHLLKRMSYRKQKRWWNAYMLFYTRLDFDEVSLVKEMSELNISPPTMSSTLSQSTLERKKKMMGSSKLKMPLAIDRSIQKQNVRFLHHRYQYTSEYFQFMRKLINCNALFVTPVTPNSDKLTQEAEELALMTVQVRKSTLFYLWGDTKLRNTLKRVFSFALYQSMRIRALRRAERPLITTNGRVTPTRVALTNI